MTRVIKGDILSLGNKVELIKETLLELHKGKNVEKIRKELKSILKSLEPWTIPIIEQKLVKEDVGIFEITKMCELPTELFRKSRISRELKKISEKHPLNALIAESSEIIKEDEKFSLYANTLADKKDIKSVPNHIYEILLNLSDIRKHFVRKQQFGEKRILDWM